MAHIDYEIPAPLSAAGLSATIGDALGDAFDGVLTVTLDGGERRLRVLLTRDISGSERAEVDAAVSAHDGSAPVKALLCDLLDPIVVRAMPLTAIDWRTMITPEVGRLRAVESFGSIGERTQRVWYWDTVDGSGDPLARPVVRESWTYVRDSVTRFPSTSTQTIEWYDSTGALMGAPTKVLPRVYSPSESIAEGKGRRRQIATSLEISTLGMMQATIPSMSSGDRDTLGLTGLSGEALESAILEIGRQFLRTHAAALDLYVQAHVVDIRDDISDSTDIWLDNFASEGTTIRAAIIAGLI